MRELNRFSLKKKVVLVNLVIVLLFVGGIVVFLNSLMVKSLTGMKRETANALLLGQARELGFALSRPEVTVEELASDPKITSYFQSKTKIESSDLVDYLKSISVGREYSNVYLMDANGEVVVSVDPTFLKNKFEYRDYFKEAMLGKTHMQIAFGTLTHKPGYYFSAPVVVDGSTVGVVVIKMDVSYVNKIFADTPLKMIGHYFLTEENGVIVSTDKEGVEEYQSLGVISDAKKKELTAERRFEGFGMKPIQYQLAQDAIDNYKGPVTLDFMDIEDNERELLQISQVNDYPFYLVTETELDTVFDKINDILWPIIYLMSGAVMLGVAVQYIIFGKFFKPLEKLEQFTQDVTSGKIDTTFEVNTGDEIESLSKSISKMIVVVEGNKEKLESAIADRTSELMKKISELDAKNAQMSTSEIAMLNILEDSRELEKQLAQEKRGVEQKVIERTKQLADEEAKLMSAISALPRAFVILDTKLNIIKHNGKLEPILGIIEGEWSVAKIDDLLGEKFGFEKLVRQTINDKKVNDIENELGKKYIRVFMAPIIGAANELIGAVATIKDTTEARALARSKDEFFSIASHELRTPLTAIRGNTSMILDYYKDVLKDPELKGMIDDTHEASVRLIGIVNDFLDMSRLEMGKVEYKIEDVKVLEIVNKVVKDLDENAKTKGVELKTEGDMAVLAKADIGKVEQVLFNIIGNSLKFTDKGSVTIKVYGNEESAHIEITDTGKGIPQANQGLLFHKFQQAGSSLVTRVGAKGTGLGLYISKLMVDGMGGKLELIKSVEGKGSVFGITLPTKEKIV